jgi:hypothetical protein
MSAAFANVITILPLIKSKTLKKSVFESLMAGQISAHL